MSNSSSANKNSESAKVDGHKSKDVTRGEAEPVSDIEKRSISELRAAAQQVLLDVVRQTPWLHFTEDQVFRVVDGAEMRRRLGLGKTDKRNCDRTFAQAADDLNKKLRTFRLEVENWSPNTNKFIARLAENAEWHDAVQEAWSYADSVNEFSLTDPGLELLRFIRSGDIDPDFMTERLISYRIGLHGRQHCLPPYLEEVVQKTGIPLFWEAKGTKYGERPSYRIWVGAGPPVEIAKLTAANPQFDVDFGKYTKADVDRARNLIHKTVLKLALAGSDELYIVAISSRRELRHCFPKFRREGSHDIAAFFQSIMLSGSLSLGYDFRPAASSWTVSLKPKVDWPSVVKAIEEEASRPTLQQLFGLGDEAARLLSWIEGLPEEEKLLGTLTPRIEDAVERSIGIECPWSADNFAVYLQLLIEEINQRTDYQLSLQPWREYTTIKSRIRIKRKPVALEVVLNQIQALAAARETKFDRVSARETIEKLLKP